MEKDKIEADAAALKKAEEVKALEQKDIDAKQAQFNNLQNAIKEANDELKKIRDGRKAVKDAFGDGATTDDDPKIDFTDPASKAWDKHIKETVNPLVSELEKEKQERFDYTLREFLEDKPLLTGDKLKSFINTYSRIKSSTGMTKEGIIEDLNKSFAAEFHSELMGYARNAEIDQAKRLILQSDAGVSRGAGNYMQQHEASPKYSSEEQEILAKWGVSPQDHAEMAKKYKDQ